MKKLILAVALSFGLNLALPVAALASPATDSSSSCVFETNVVDACQSSNPDVTVNINNLTDTSQCTILVHINWGDGTAVQDFTIPGGPAGAEHLADHTYTTAPGTYSISATGSILSGPCTFGAGGYQFTLLPSRQCTPDYCVPADWNTQYANTLTPGIEPLNVIIGARSNVSLDAILAAMNNWGEVTTGTLPFGCLSAENANVDSGYVVQEYSWRLKGCIGGNKLSLKGDENHVRLWNQPIAGSQFGAWFIAASFETLCLDTTPNAPGGKHIFETFRGSPHFDKLTLAKWHCIDGGSGSFGSNGYDHGAADFVTSLSHAAQKQGWQLNVRTITRPLNGMSTGEDGVQFSGKVYVVTITQP